MKVMFLDKQHDVYHVVDDVKQIWRGAKKIEGQLIPVWHVQKEDDSVESFNKDDFEIHRVSDV
jgi:hypothetical protein